MIKPPSLYQNLRESTSTIGPIVPFEREDTPYDEGLDYVLEAKSGRIN